MRWLLANERQGPRSPSICHGDFHPLNVLVDKGTVSGVIDWTYTRIADPAYDVGATIALFGQGPIDPSLIRPGPLRACSAGGSSAATTAPTCVSAL